MSAAPTSVPQSATQIFQALESYNWDDDVEFQSGLSAILGDSPSPAQAEELTLRARCFYYTRKFSTPVDFNAYKAYHSALSPTTQTTTPSQPQRPNTSHQAPEPSGILPSPQNASEPPAPYPISFAHIVELVTTGQPIPGIKEIPATVLTGQGTKAERTVRRKPWERDGGEGEGLTGEGGV